MHYTNKVLHIFATLGPIGFMPASGTIATMLTLPLVYILSMHTTAYIIVLCIFSALSIPAVQQVQDHLRTHDPSCVVLDEVVGCLITFIMLPFSWWLLLIGFVLFRMLDIFKPWPIQLLERISGPWGVLLDDAAAGLLSATILHIIYRCV